MRLFLLLLPLLAAVAALLDRKDWVCGSNSDSDNLYNDLNKHNLQSLLVPINNCCKKISECKTEKDECRGAMQKCLDEFLSDSGRYDMKMRLHKLVQWEPLAALTLPSSLSAYSNAVKELREKCRASVEGISKSLKDFEKCLSLKKDGEEKKCTCESSFYSDVRREIFDRERRSSCYRRLGELRAIAEPMPEKKKKTAPAAASFDPFAWKDWKTNWVIILVIYFCVGTFIICCLAGCVAMTKLRVRKGSDPIGTERVCSRRSSRSVQPTKSVNVTTRSPKSKSTSPEASSVSPTESPKN